MIYHPITVSGREYKLRLDAQNTVNLEKKMGKSLLDMIQNAEHIAISDIILFLHASLQAMEHGISLDDTYKLYDAMVDEGIVLEDLLGIMLKTMEASGFLRGESAKA